MNLSKELKKKRDMEDRLRQTSPQKVFFPDGFIDLSQFANKNHTHEFIDLTDTPSNYVADKFIKVNAEGDGLEYGDGGGLAEIPQATETTLGGIKAKAKTTETSEVAIDNTTGKLYSAAPDEAANGVKTGGAIGQIYAKKTNGDYDCEWIDPPSGGGGVLEIPISFASSSYSSSYPPSFAFDGLLSTYWSANGAIGQFIGMNFKRYINVKKIYITDTNNRLKDFVFEGSIDGNNYITLLSATRPNLATEVEYSIPESSNYIYYRLRCTGTLYAGSNMTIHELRMEYSI